VTRFVVDRATLLRIAAGEIDVAPEHRLVAPTLVRSQARKVAEELGWADTFDAEFVALTQLQGDALVTADAELARAASALVKTATPDALASA
jgi:predicted nucleic acid-binding protein